MSQGSGASLAPEVPTRRPDDTRVDGDRTRPAGRTARPPRSIGGLLSLLAAAIGLSALNLAAAYNYLLFHSLVELLGVTVAFGVFVIAWNSRDFSDNRYLLYFGLASPFVALLALLHTLAYRGMGVFEDGSNLATQLWVARHYLDASAFLGAALAVGRKLRPPRVLAAYSVAVALVLLAIFQWKVFPTCYVEGHGLTAFKKASEYIICALLGVALVALLRKREHFDPRVLRRLVGAMGATIASSLCFTTYVNVYGSANQVGHLLSVAAVYLVYLAVIDTSFRTPYLLLFHELKRSEDELRQARTKVEAAYEREHRIAMSFQSALLIKEHTRVAGYEVAGMYRPALRGEADVGGDFYNLFPLGERHTGLVLGDVGGKGLDAAVVAARVQHTLMSLAFAGQSPGEALRTARRIVSADDPDQIVTVFLGILARDTGRLDWSSAGHEPALLLHAGEQRTEMLCAVGPPLFGIDFGGYDTQTSTLAPGDSLFLYTDGLPEAHASPYADLLGEERVAELLLRHQHDPPEAVIQAMYRAAQQQSEGRLHDDIALLLLRRGGTAASLPQDTPRVGECVARP